jgi:hypothetical protein
MVGAAAYSLISGGAEVALPRPVVSAAYVVIGAVTTRLFVRAAVSRASDQRTFAP